MRNHRGILPGHADDEPAGLPKGRIRFRDNLADGLSHLGFLRFGTVVAELRMHDALVEHQRLREPPLVLAAHGRLADAREYRHHLMECPDLAVERVVIRMREDVAQAVLDERQCLLDERPEGVGPVLADELIGVLAVWHDNDADAGPRIAHNGQCAYRCLLPRLVAVVAEAYLRCVVQELLRMLRRERRAERCDHIVHAGVEHRYRIHVALDDDGPALLLDGAVRAVEAEEQLPLIEEDGLRCVEILRCRIIEDAAAEADDAPALIRNRDDHAPAEAVVEAASLLALGTKTACQQKLLLDSTLEESRGQLIPGRRCVAELKFLDGLLADAARGEVGLAPLAHARHRQAVVEEVARELIDLAQVLYLAVPRDFLRASLALGQRDAQLLCLQLDCVKIRDVFDKRNKLERVAAGMTAEAVEEALVG